MTRSIRSALIPAIYEFATDRRIEHVKVGRLTRVPIAALNRYVTTHTVRAVDDQDADV